MKKIELIKSINIDTKISKIICDGCGQEIEFPKYCTKKDIKEKINRTLTMYSFKNGKNNAKVEFDLPDFCPECHNKFIVNLSNQIQNEINAIKGE